MTVARYQKTLDQILIPIGFRRKGQIWNRHLENYIDVISIQKSKSLNSITINIGVCNADIYLACWQHEVPSFIDESVCIFRARIGELVGDTDIWWDVNDENAPAESLGILKGLGLNLLMSFHSTEKLISYLKNVIIKNPYYPLPIIYLSLLLKSADDQTEGMKLLLECRKRTSGPWKDRIEKIMNDY